MHRFAKASAMLAFAVILGGCYNARIETGLEPSDQVIAEEWAASWIYGAVSPETVNVASQCPNGVAQVHTYHSFLNMLVSGLTFGIFTPMTIKVTCAAAGGGAASRGASDVHIDKEAPTDQQVRQFQEAVDLARATGRAISVVF